MCNLTMSNSKPLRDFRMGVNSVLLKALSSLVFRSWALITLCSFILQVEDCAQLIAGHFERQSHVLWIARKMMAPENFLSKKLLMSQCFGWLLLTVIGERGSSWWPSTCLILILNFPSTFKLWAHLDPGWPQVHMEFPPPPWVSTFPSPDMMETGTWPGATQWLWEPKRFKMSSLVKQLPILFPCRSFLTSGKIVSGCCVHFMVAYVLKVERWLLSPGLPWLWFRTVWILSSSHPFGGSHLGHKQWFLWAVWASEFSKTLGEAQQKFCIRF